MIKFIIIFSILLIGLVIYALCYASAPQSKVERALEDEEQLEYIKEWNKTHSSKRKRREI